jgi:hypothetical protein
MRFWFLRFVLALTIGGLSLAAGITAPNIVHAQTYGPAYAVPMAGGTMTVPVSVMPQTSYGVSVTTPSGVTVTSPVAVSSQPSTVAVTTQPITQPVYQSTTGTTDMPPDACWPYDSWCSYCYYNNNPDVCQAFPPGRMTGRGTSSGAPGVGSPSTTPAGSSPSPQGGGGTGNNPTYPTPSR